MGFSYTLGEIRMIAANFAPVGWRFCNGDLVAISEYTALFSLIGTTYGGDGVNTFALPDLRGRVPIHQGQGNGLSNYVIGEQAGAEAVTLLAAQMPQHSHGLQAATSQASFTDPATHGLVGSGLDVFTSSSGGLVQMNAAAIAPSGGSQPHENMAPFLGVNFIISMTGVFSTPG